MDTYPQITLKAGKEDSLRRFHPWIFSGAIDASKSPKGLEEGDLVRVCDSLDHFLCIGQLAIGSIAIRALSFRDQKIDQNFYTQRISSAYQLRQSLNLISPNNNIYRLVHGEGDHLPGLIIDIYGCTAVIQAHTVGMHLHRHWIAQALLQVFKSSLPLTQIYYKSESTLPHKAEIEAPNEYLYQEGNTQDQTLENGLIFIPNWIEGQKTGFFIDQRDNRALVGEYAKGRKVLNMFCYTGGFSLYALQGGAQLVHSVDASAKAIALTNAQVETNFGSTSKNKEALNHQSFIKDAFEFMEELPQNAYDLIILDPPAFAKHKNVVRQALQGYRRINAKAFEKIAPGGLLFTFSCSQAIDKDHFRQAVFSAAAMAKRKVRILKQLSQCSDHPINIYHPEGEYLKGLMLYVE